MLFELFLRSHGTGINLQERLTENQLLSLGEVEALVRACRLPIDQLAGSTEKTEIRQVHSSTNSLESRRARSQPSSARQISLQVAGTRLQVIRDYQPNLKTRARVVPIGSSLLDDTRQYVLDHRSRIPGARKHEFLFVSSRGNPLSIPALAKIFEGLREKHPELPADLSPHVMRPTWNDAYSREMDRQRASEETERKTRTYLMGWSPTSEMAVIYTRRHVRAKARKASLALQKNLVQGDQNDE